MMVDYPDLAAVLEDALGKERSGWDRDGKVYASDLGTALDGGPCKRAFWHKLRNEPTKPTSPGTNLMFAQGDNLHEYMVRLLTKYLPFHGWAVVEDEGRVRSDDLSGRFDLHITSLTSVTELHLVIDFKTKRANAMKYLPEAKPGDVAQLRFYVRAKDADGGILLYIDREGGNFVKSFFVTRDDDAVAENEANLMALARGDEPAGVSVGVTVKMNKGPNAIYLTEPWQMRYCALANCRCSPGFSVPTTVVGHVTDGGEITMLDKYEERWGDYVRSVLNRRMGR